HRLDVACLEGRKGRLQDDLALDHAVECLPPDSHDPLGAVGRGQVLCVGEGEVSGGVHLFGVDGLAVDRGSDTDGGRGGGALRPRARAVGGRPRVPLPRPWPGPTDAPAATPTARSSAATFTLFMSIAFPPCDRAAAVAGRGAVPRAPFLADVGPGHTRA